EVSPLGAPLRGELVDLVAQFSLAARLSRSWPHPASLSLDVKIFLRAVLAQPPRGLRGQLGLGIKLGKPVPGEVHQVRRNLLELRRARGQPPLAGERDHPDEHLRIEGRELRGVTPSLELVTEDVLDLAGDVAA